MQFMTRERSLGLFRVSPWRVPMSGSLGLCMATYDITDAVLGTFDLCEPLARIVGDGIFDLSGFCEPWSKASRICVPVCRDVHF